MEEKNIVYGELSSLLKSGMPDGELSEKLLGYHWADVAAVFPDLDGDAQARIQRALTPEQLSELYSYLDNPEDYLGSMDRERAADIIESMDADDAVDVLGEMDENARSELIELMDDEAVEDINLIRSYGEDTVGSRMTTNFILIRSDMSIRAAMKSLIEQAAENDNVSTVYVEDENGVYCGAINLRDLIVARDGSALSDIIISSYPSVRADELITDCIERLKDYGEDSIPVLGASGEALGVITASDLVEAVDDELGDDYAKLGGLASEEELGEPVARSVKKRLPWLVILLGLGLVVSLVVGQFETVIKGLPFIVFFQSLVLDMAGNVGTQSLAVTIRVLTDDSVGREGTLKLIGKETLIGLLNGLILGICSCVATGGFLCIENPVETAFLMSGCIGVSLLLAMTFSSFFGTVIPVFFKKIHIDPAVASGPLITTINDLIAVVVYYGLAWLLILGVV